MLAQTIVDTWTGAAEETIAVVNVALVVAVAAVATVAV